MTGKPAESKVYSRFINGLDCPDCASKIEDRVSRIDGVAEAHISIVNSRLDVRFEELADSASEVERVLSSLGYGAGDSDIRGGKARPWDGASSRLRWLLTVVSGLFILLGAVGSRIFGLPDYFSLPEGAAGAVPGFQVSFSTLFYLISVLLSGPPTFRKGILAIRNRNLDMNFLMTVAVVGAIAIGEWIEGAAVVFLFSLANLLESFTMSKARNAIESLMDLSPKMATVKRDGKEIKVPVEDVNVNELVLVKPGGRIPVDGSIRTGRSNVDQSTITGESTPVPKEEGSPVFAGTINGQGFLEVVVEKKSEDTTLSRILHMVEEAQVQRAPAQRFIDRFSRFYTPLVVAGAVAVALVPTLLFQLPFDVWFYRALVLLLVACPCALVISTPVTIISGLASAARQGILIKGGAFLEEASRLNAIAFDKTGTITHGRHAVTGVYRYGESSELEILQLAATIETLSEHPLARAILEYATGKEIKPDVPESFLSLPGEGAKITLGGKDFFAGNHRLFEERGMCPEHLHGNLRDLEEQGNTAIFIGSDKTILGAITLEDQLRSGVENILKALRDYGVRRLTMLTGDNEETARGIAKRIGIDDYRAEQMPQDKAAAIEELRAQHGHVAMVGDGVNDAPALATATVGIAMGVAGSDAALETADIALMADDLSNLPVVIGLSRKVVRVIKQNTGFALLTKVVFLTLAPLGFVNLWMAVAADMGASMIVILNGLRLLAPVRKQLSPDR